MLVEVPFVEGIWISTIIWIIPFPAMSIPGRKTCSEWDLSFEKKKSTQYQGTCWVLDPWEGEVYFWEGGQPKWILCAPQQTRHPSRRYGCDGSGTWRERQVTGIFGNVVAGPVCGKPWHFLLQETDLFVV